MKKVGKVLTLGAAALALALAFPVATHATCPQLLQISMCFGAGMDVIGTTTNSHFVDPNSGIGGSFWRAGSGDPAIGPGDDSGLLGRPVVDPTTFGGGDWMSDFFIGDGSSAERCFVFDWGASGLDGCGGTGGGNVATPADVAVAVITDTSNNYAVLSVAGNTVYFEWDDILLLGGGAGMLPNLAGNVGIPLQRAVHVINAVAGNPVQVEVAPLAYNAFDELGGARYPTAASLSADLYGWQGGVWTALGTGPAGGIVAVDQDMPLCWGFTTGEFTPSDISTGNGHLGVACVLIGGATPSQNVDKAIARKDAGQMKFEWHVTAQLDIQGFDIVSIDPTKNSERKLNSSPIFRGGNDGTEESYSVSVPRSVVKRPGVFELRMTRQDGSVTATTFVNE